MDETAGVCDVWGVWDGTIVEERACKLTDTWVGMGFDLSIFPKQIGGNWSGML